jgi:glycerophosphoryl diester phosphodiesterase
VVAHRGASAEAPENTLGAFELAAGLGADGLELDVRRAGDGSPVVIHDATLDRTTDASGPVAARSAAELTDLGVPPLSGVFEAHPALPITVDVKDREAVADVADLATRTGRAGRTVLYAEGGTGLSSFRDYPGPRATSRRQALRFSLLDRWIRGLLPPGFPEVVHTPARHRGVNLVTPGFVRAVHRTDRTVQVWTVNDPERMRRLADWGVDAIVTDDVRRAVDLLGRRPGSAPGPGEGPSTDDEGEDAW